MNEKLFFQLIESGVPFVILTDGTVVVNAVDSVLQAEVQEVSARKGVGGTIPIGGYNDSVQATSDRGVGGTIPIGGFEQTMFVRVKK